MESKKLVWRVGSEPTGQYRSFENREWPSATFGKDGDLAVYISSSLSYTPKLGKMEDVGEDLVIRVAIPSGNSFEWRSLKARVQNLAKAKELAQKFFDANPQYVR